MYFDIPFLLSFFPSFFFSIDMIYWLVWKSTQPIDNGTEARTNPRR